MPDRDPTLPAPDRLADRRDEDGWTVERDGRMAACATDDDVVTTVPYSPIEL